MYSIRQIQSRNPEHPWKVSSFIYLLDKMSRVLLGKAKVLGGEKKLCFLRLNHRKWNKCQKETTNWFCLILALPRSGCTACWAHLPQEHDELYGRLRISRWERSRLSLSENILSLFWRAFKWTWSLIGRSDEDCSTSGSSWVQSRRSADGFLIFWAVRRLLGFEPKDRFCLTSELFSLSKRK